MKINSINKTLEYILEHQDMDRFAVSHSSGKDSVVNYDIWLRALKILEIEHPEVYGKINDKWEIVFENTSNDTADTYKFIKNKLPKDRVKIINPKMGFWQWIKEVKNYFTPTVMVRNCCTEYKEGQLHKYYDKKEKITMVTGMRKYESKKRSKYDYVMDHKFKEGLFGDSNMPKTWIMFNPIIEWQDEEIWLYIIRENLEVNKMYEKGFHRCGCLICPFQHDYIDILIQEYYPKQWDRWLDILKQNYNLYNIERRLKWTLKEWQQGKWKEGTSKIHKIIHMKMTDNRVKQIAQLMNISEDMAKKYFNQRCKCEKKMNPTELAMFYKVFGRYENIQEDSRDLLCKKCMCKEMGWKQKEYKEKAIEFREGGCDLF